MNKEEILKMSKEEIIRQLEWSDHHEFSYWLAKYLLEENGKMIEEIIHLQALLKILESSDNNAL